MIRRKLSIPLLLAASIAAPLWAGTHSVAAFKKLQSLAGNWVGKDGHGMVAKTSFKVLASGTAVMETLSPADMEEMVTLYSIDGDGIALVHYCPTNNQPRMRVVPDSDDVKDLSFDSRAPATSSHHPLAINTTSSSVSTMPTTSQKPGHGGRMTRIFPCSSTSLARRIETGGRRSTLTSFH